MSFYWCLLLHLIATVVKPLSEALHSAGPYTILYMINDTVQSTCIYIMQQLQVGGIKFNSHCENLSEGAKLLCILFNNIVQRRFLKNP